MITIIEHGNRVYQVKCDRCNCLFQYNLTDVQELRFYGKDSDYGYKHDGIICPECGEFIEHYKTNKI